MHELAARADHAAAGQIPFYQGKTGPGCALRVEALCGQHEPGSIGRGVHPLVAAAGCDAVEGSGEILGYGARLRCYSIDMPVAEPVDNVPHARACAAGVACAVR